MIQYLQNKNEILKSLEPKNPLNHHFNNLFQKLESRFNLISFFAPKKKEGFFHNFYGAISYFIPYKKEQEPQKLCLNNENNNENIIQEEITNLKNNIKNSTELINKIIDYYISSNKKEYNNILEKIKLSINNYYNNNKFRINSWIMIKSIEKDTINFDQYNYQNYSISLYEINQLKSSNSLSLLHANNIPNSGVEYQINNYFIRNQGEDLYIYKDYKSNKLFIPQKNIFINNGLYDYDSKSDSLLIYKKEKIKNEFRKSIGLYSGNNPCKMIDTQFIGDNDIKKMILIPCDKNCANQSAIFFIEVKLKEKIIIIINNLTMNIIESENLELNKEFTDYTDFNEFQFIVHTDFLLILKYYDNDVKWKGKIYSLNFEDDSLFKKISEIELKDDKKSKFSFIESSEKNHFLLSLNICQNQPIIKYWEIYLNFSKIIINSSLGNNNKNNLKDLSLGNCIVNYFYHSFEKYHLISSIEYNININNDFSTKFNIFLGKKNIKNLGLFEQYIKNLIKKSNENKKIDFDEIKFEFLKNHKNMYNKNNSSLGDIILKIFETTPIQIAKIINNEFEIMSDWKQLNTPINTSKGMDEIKESIKLGMKEIIFYEFDFPIIVICCFGTQSIGKSTFLNELTGSMFNISGMRCTEGIWLSLRIFKNIDEKNKKTKSFCNKDCCECSKNKCYKYISHNDKCLCENCICQKNCELKGNSNCEEKCSLKKNHEEFIKCSYTNCKCICVCDCQCNKNSVNTKKHEHICRTCFKNNENECLCKCNCRHLCRNPVLNHNFICVSLDFEGLGTFERKSEHDILMALIGSGIGNNIIIRMGASFDKFTENFFEKLSEGSRKIRNINISQFFGGSLCFSPKDVIDKINMFQEFKKKLEISTLNWRNEEEEKKNKNNAIMSDEIEKNNNYIFGLFKDWIWIPTPIINDVSFYGTLRQDINKLILEDSLSLHRQPIYKTGKEFYNNLRVFLSAIYFLRFDFLGNNYEKSVEKYIEKCLEQAYEISEIISENKIGNENLKDDIICEKNGLKFINNKFIDNLEIEIIIFIYIL